MGCFLLFSERNASGFQGAVGVKPSGEVCKWKGKGTEEDAIEQEFASGLIGNGSTSRLYLAYSILVLRRSYCM